MDRKTYLELEEMHKKLWYIGKTLDTIGSTQGIHQEDIAKCKEYIESMTNDIGDVSNRLSSVEDKAESIIGDNLILNSRFNINQRGATKYTASGYTVDRWKNENSNGTVSVIDGGITFTASGGEAYLVQRLDGSKSLVGEVVTLSVEMLDGTKYEATDTLLSLSGSYCVISIPDTTSNIRVFYYSSTGYFAPTITVGSGESVSIRSIKLEIGDHATYHTSRPYQEELALCERYYHEISFTGNSQLAGGISNGGTLYVILQYKCNMRRKPTITFSSSTGATMYNIYNGLSGRNVPITKVATGFQTTWQAALTVTHSTTDSSGASVPAGSYLHLRMLANSKISIDAEI